MARKVREPIIITLDTETIGLDGGLKRIAIYDGKEVLYGYTFGDIEWKLEAYYKMGFMPHVYIHNADFDLRKILSIFRKGNVLWNTTKKINNKYARLTCKKYIIHDSLKIFPGTLASLSEDFELEHGKLDLWEAVQQTYPGQYNDHVDFLTRCDKDDPLYLEYLGYDVISLYELIEKMMEIAKLDKSDFVRILSTASLSRFLFKNGYGGIQFRDQNRTKSDFEILTSCKAWSSKKKMPGTEITYLDCENKIRQGYYGGRTEVFTPICNHKGFHYDVNSLYPSQMGHAFPIGYPEYMDDKEVCRIMWEDWLENHEGQGFIKAHVYVPQQKIPPLPAKMGKLAFPTGHIEGTWAYIELEYAVLHCGVEVLEISEVIHFRKTYPVFRRFIDCFYQIKAQASIDGNESLRSFAKLIMNTSYGWTCLNRFDKTCLRDIDKLEEWEAKDPDRIIYTDEELGCFEMWDVVNTETVQVPVGAYITAYARLVLLDALRHQAEEGEVYYCDTDSIVCDAALPENIVDEYEMGFWDLEKVIDYGLFIQPKVYYEDINKEFIKKNKKATIKFKGVTKKRQSELSRGYYQRILKKLQAGDKGKMLIEENRTSLPSLAVSQKKGADPNKLTVMDKTMNLGAMQKRDIDYNLNCSKPWHMETIEMFRTFDFKIFDNEPLPKNNLFGGLKNAK